MQHDGTSPAEAAAILEEGQTAVARLAARVPEEEAVRRNAIGGGEWSLKDLLGHLAHWEELALETIARSQADDRISRVALDDVDEENANDIARKLDWPLERVRTEARSTHERLLAEIRSTSVEDWNRPRPFDGGGERTLGSMLGSVLGAPERPFGHAWAHLREVEEYLSSLG
ncbi:MAG: DinB family protein [Actinomycetota bacterium]